MAVTNGYGQGAVNNTIDWGKGKTTATNDWGKIYDSSASGDTSLGTAAAFSNLKSIDLDGVDDYVTMGNTTSLNFERTDAFSLSFWFKTDAPASFSVLYGKSLTSGAGYMVWNQASKINFRIRNASGSQLRITANTTTPNNLWTHCVITYDGSSLNSGLEMYINGSLESALKQGTLTSGSSQTTASFNISTRNDGNSPYNGLMDECAVFNSELSASDVTAIYGSGVPTSLSSYSSLVSWWRCGDDDTSPTSTDNKGSNNGTMTNFSTFSTDVPT